MASRTTGIAAKLQIDLREWTAGAKRGEQDMKQLAAGADAIRRRQAEAQTRHVQKMVELEGKAKPKAFGPQTREDFNSGQKALRLERERHSLEMANLERRGKMEQKLAENRERYANRRLHSEDTGQMHGPGLRQYEPVRAQLSGSGWRTGANTMTGSRPDAMFNQMGRGATNAGMALLMFSQIADDAQYGLKSIVNNIGPAIMAMGGGTGLAGAATILTVALNVGMQAWDKWNKTTELATANAEALASRQELLKNMTEQAAAAAEEQNTRVRFFMDRTAETRGLFDSMISREGRLLELEKELADARAASLDGVEALDARQRSARDFEIKSAQQALDIAEGRLRIDKEKAESLAAEYESARKELESLNAARASTPGGLSPRGENRATFLGTLLPGLGDNRDAANQRYQQGLENVNSARQRLGPEAEMRAKIDAEEKAQAVREETEKKNREAWAKTEAAIAAAAGRAKEAWDAVAAAAKRAADQQKQQGDIKGDLEIARLRGRGQNAKADKLQADRSEASRAAEFQAAGIPAAEAKKMAASERQYKEDAQSLSRGGRRKLRSAGGGGNYVGLGDKSQFQGGMAGEWNFSALDAAKADRRARPLKAEAAAAAAAAKAAPSNENMGGSEVLTLLRAIRDATLGNRGSVADKLLQRRR